MSGIAQICKYLGYRVFSLVRLYIHAMFITESAPVEKKWGELMKYNIFIMKIIESGIAFILLMLPVFVPKPAGHMFCIAAGPTFIISLLFIILYIQRKVPLFMEKLYLFFQIMFTFGAFLQCFLKNIYNSWLWLIYGTFYFGMLTALCLDLFLIANERDVPVEKNFSELLKYNIFAMKIIEFGIAFILTMLPLVITRPAGDMHCIASGPTLVISLLFIVLYIRRKVPLFMEKMYLFFQILFTFGAFIQCFLLNISHVLLWLTYGVFYLCMLTALSLDLYMIANERGCTFSCA